MSKTDFNFKIAGPAGEGIKVSGIIFSKTCIRHGLSTNDYTEYPSLIRGGHNTYQVHAGMEKIHSQVKLVDVLVALNTNAVAFHYNELNSESVLIYDAADSKTDIAKYPITAKVYNVPLVELAKSVGADRMMYNNVALGVCIYLLNLDLELLNNVINDTFKGKGESVVNLNQNAAKAGYDFAKTNFPQLSHIQITKQPIFDNLDISGNEAMALGAIAGGLKAYFAYPMTPSSTILHALAEWSDKADVFVKHAEDEIGVINMALGASFAGVKSACGTAGGGFCYMTEAVGMAGISELPLVIYEGMRPGPAGGMPTWTGQGDLQFVIWAAQDEFPRVVLAPGDVRECFDLSKLAYVLADQYQLPVIVQFDKYVGEGNQSIHLDQTTFNPQPLSRDNNPTLDETGFYKRYSTSGNGVTLRTIPGQSNGTYIAPSYEHDEHGITTEESDERTRQVNKRASKLELLKAQIPHQFYDGSEHPEITFISYGSTIMPIKEALKDLRSRGVDAAALNLSWLWPFPVEQVTKILSNSICPVVVEGNNLQQLARLIRQETGIDIYHKRNKYDGRPFYPEEIIQYTKEIINK